MSTLTAVIGVLTLIALGVAVIVVADEILHRRRRKPRWTDLIGIDPDFTNGACTVDYLSWSHSEPRRDFLHDGCWLRLSGVGDLTEQERLISWAGLMELLDEHWPADIFPTLEDDLERDAGARIVSLLRWVDRLKDLVAAQEQATSETEPADECDHTALSRMYRRERNDARAEVERVKNLVCDREDLIIERDAALARVEAVCATAIRVRTERMVEGSLVHIAAKDAIDTFAEAVRDAMLDTAEPFHAQHGQNIHVRHLDGTTREIAESMRLLRKQRQMAQPWWSPWRAR